ncbi:MAG: DUF885 family protein [Pseudomonadota bacterium]
MIPRFIHRLIFTAGLALAACAPERPTPEPHSPEEIAAFDEAIAQISKPLDFSAMRIVVFGGGENASDQDAASARRRIDTHRARLEALAPFSADRLDACRAIDLGRARSIASVGLREARLEHRLAMADVALGEETDRRDEDWFGLELQKWTDLDLTPEAAFAFAEAELARAQADFKVLQAELGFAGDLDGLEAHLNREALRLAEDADIQARMRETRDVIRANLARAFHGDYGAPPVKIRRFPRPDRLPAEALYDGGTLRYNPLDGVLNARKVDLLVLHEGAPGHHLQMRAAATARRCPRTGLNRFHWAFTEGWGSYVEDLGDTLGVYTTPEAKLYAVEWRMSRAARLAMSIGLHHLGWTEEEARAYWRAEALGQSAVEDQQIQRARLWPARTAAYLYGADMFRRMRALYMADGRGDLRDFHDLALTYGPMPPQAFEALIRRAVIERQTGAPWHPSGAVLAR